jgi:hypothetical protein
MSSTTSSTAPVPTSGQIYQAINGEITDAKGILASLNQQLALYKEQVAMYQSQLTFSQSDSNYVDGLEAQINSLNASLASYLAFLSTRTQPLSYAQTQLDTAVNVLATVYSQVQSVAQLIYQSMTNINTVNNAVLLTYTDLMNYNQSNNPLNPNNNSGVLPPPSNLAPMLKTTMDSGLATLEALANLFIELIAFLMQIQALIGLTNYLSDGFTDQVSALSAIQAHLDYREKNDTVNVTTITGLLNTAKTNLANTQASIAAINLDLGLLNVESAAALSSTQTT